MDTTEPITVRTDKKTVAKLDALAAQSERSRNYLVNQAIEEFLDVRHFQMQKIEESIAAANRGGLVAHAKVAADIRRITRAPRRRSRK
jgi:predicted transcriptional regulator